MEAASTIEQRFGLGAIDQISFIVADVDEAVPRYAAMFGPINVVEVPPMDFVYRGKPVKTTLKLGFGQTGSIEVELVQVLDGEYPSLEFLRERGEGLHHVRFPVADLAATRAQMEAEGFELTLSGGSGDLLFAYLESPLLNGMTVEIIEGMTALQ